MGRSLGAWLAAAALTLTASAANAGEFSQNAMQNLSDRYERVGLSLSLSEKCAGLMSKAEYDALGAEWRSTFDLISKLPDIGARQKIILSSVIFENTQEEKFACGPDARALVDAALASMRARATARAGTIQAASAAR
jgi:hypothetical protein